MVSFRNLFAIVACACAIAVACAASSTTYDPRFSPLGNSVGVKEEARFVENDVQTFIRLEKDLQGWQLSSLKKFISRHGGKIVKQIRHKGQVADLVVRVGSKSARQKLEQLLQDNGAVANAHSDYILRKYTCPSFTNISPVEDNLDRIDEHSPVFDDVYKSCDNQGTGVTAYIVDTGIRVDHVEFNGRVRTPVFFDAFGDGNEDCDGHGTHVASLVGGATYGVAKNVTFESVRVLDCEGSGTFSGILAGLQEIYSRGTLPAVINLSLGSQDPTFQFEAMDNVLQELADAGFYVVNAAGNSDYPACVFDKGALSVQNPIAVVGAADHRSTGTTDSKMYFSNWGRCVNIWAPGAPVIGASHTSSTNLQSLQGTSQAAPHVSGVAAVYLSRFPSATAQEVHNAMIASSTDGVITNGKHGSPDNMLFSDLTASADCPNCGTPCADDDACFVMSGTLSPSATVNLPGTTGFGPTRLNGFHFGWANATGDIDLRVYRHNLTTGANTLLSISQSDLTKEKIVEYRSTPGESLKWTIRNREAFPIDYSFYYEGPIARRLVDDSIVCTQQPDCTTHPFLCGFDLSVSNTEHCVGFHLPSGSTNGFVWETSDTSGTCAFDTVLLLWSCGASGHCSNQNTGSLIAYDDEGGLNSCSRLNTVSQGVTMNPGYYEVCVIKWAILDGFSDVRLHWTNNDVCPPSPTPTSPAAPSITPTSSSAPSSSPPVSTSAAPSTTAAPTGSSSMTASPSPSFTTAPTTLPVFGRVAHLTFDEGHGYRVKNTGTSAQFTEGRVNGEGTAWSETGLLGGSLYFDGTSSHVNLGHADVWDVDPSLDAFTFNVWVAPEDTTDLAVLFARAEAGPRQYVVYRRPNGGLLLYVGGTQHSVSSVNLEVGSFSMVTLVNEFNGGSGQFESKVYVNGTLAATMTPGTAMTPTDMLLGARRETSLGGYAFMYKGYMDEFSMFNTSLDASYIADLYQVTLANQLFYTEDVYPGFNYENHKVLHVPFDEFEGESVANIGNSEPTSGSLNAFYPAWKPTAGVRAGSLDFEAPDYVRFNKTDAIDLGPDSDEFSFSLWFFPYDTSDYQALFGLGSRASKRQFMVYLWNDGTIMTYVGGSRIATASTHREPKWHHVAVTNTAENGGFVFRVYVNGVLSVSQSSGSGRTILDGILVSGRYKTETSSDTVYRFQGRIDELKVFDIALNATEIADVYAQELSSPETSIEDFMPVHLPLDETSGTNAANFGTDQTVSATVGGTASPTWLSGGSCMDGGCLQLDGIDDHISMGLHETLNLLPRLDEYTITIWAKRLSFNEYHVLFGRGSAPARRQYMLYLWNDNSVRGYVGGFNADGAVVDDSEFHMFALVNTRAVGTSKFNYTVYMDGEYLFNYLSGANTDPVDSLIGARRDGSNSGAVFPFNGVVDDYRLYRMALSGGDVRRIWGEVIYGVPRIGNLIAYYSFEETSGSVVADSGRHNGAYNASLGGSFGWNPSGVIGGALELNGGTAHGLVGNPAALQFRPLEDSYTVTAWVQFSVDNVYHVVFSKAGDLNAERSLAIYRWNSNEFSVIVGGTRSTGAALPNNQWVCLSVRNDVRRSGELSVATMFLDGAPVNNFFAGSGTTTDPVVIGARWSAGGTPKLSLNGLIDDLQVFDAALTDVEVAATCGL